MSVAPQHLESRPARIGRWAMAAVVVSTLHAAALALALMQPPEEDADAPAGSMMVELTSLPVPPAPPPIDSPDVAHGPDQQMAKQAPDTSKEAVEKVKEEDIPPLEPSPEPEPEVALPKRKPAEKEEPKEEKVEKAPAQIASPQPNANIPITTAPPRVEAPPTPSPAPKQHGLSAVKARVVASWQKTVTKHLARYKSYPEAARQKRQVGAVSVRFIVDRAGQLLLAEVTKSSGSPILDAEALEMLKRASPMPLPPAEVPDPFLENTIRIDFHVK